MKAGKITAKLRDAVPVLFMVDGKEVKQYKNIEIPDALKELEIKDFRFNVNGDKITFSLFFDKNILPVKMPPERPKVTRADKAAAKATATAAPNPAPVIITPDKSDKTPTPIAKPNPATAPITPPTTATKPAPDTKPPVKPTAPPTKGKSAKTPEATKPGKTADKK